MPFTKFADIDEQCSKNNQLKREDISILQEWQIMQPHLPSPIHLMETVVFLHASSYSIEDAKKRIEKFYTFRTQHREITANLDPFGAELQLGLNTILVTILPELTPEGYMVIYGHLRNTNPDAYNCNTMLKMIDMITILAVMRKGCQKGFVGVINMEGTTLAHLLKTNVSSAKYCLTYIQRVAPIGFKAFHFVNCVPFMDKINALMKPFYGKGFSKKVFLHYGDNASIFKFVPKNMLPVECGGESFCAEEYFKNVTWKDMECHSEYFKNLEAQLVDETKRPVIPEFDVDIFGVEGKFRKLDID